MDVSSPPRRRRARRPPPASQPGTLATGPEAAPTQIRVLGFGPQVFEEKILTQADELKEWRTRFPALWVDISGFANADVLQKIAEIFELHPLALADAVNTGQRPKIERYDAYDFIVVRMANRVDRADVEQLAIFLGGRFVLTFQEFPGDCLDPVRERLRSPNGRMREKGSDYVAYAILDAVVDFYFPVLEHYGETLDQLEDILLNRENPKATSQLHQLKPALLTYRRSLWPLRDALNNWLRDPGPRVKDETRIYLRDCYDHTVQLIDLLETYRELVSDLIDIHLSMINARMNEVMKVLTIISTLFIPMTFIASIYGMNFKFMPELEWRYGYEFALGLMGLVAVIMLVYFRRKRWF